jgi:hypothetical protein
MAALAKFATAQLAIVVAIISAADIALWIVSPIGDQIPETISI